jgi:hypothetical protein
MQSDKLLRNTTKIMAPEPIRAGGSVSESVQDFQPISLKEMDRVKLMDRFDKKFVFSVEKLNTIL